jgi:DNA-binding MarR family transcriptional regulator
VERGVTDEQLDEAITVFGQAARLLDGLRLHVWEERGLTLPQLRILFRIRQEPGIGTRELAQVFAVSPSSITQQVDRLAARNLVTRAERPEDRRQVAHTITETGEVVAGEISQEARTYLGSLLARLSPRERDQLTHLLQRLLDAAQAAPAPESTVVRR